MATNIIYSLTAEEIAEAQYLSQFPKEREKAISFLLEEPRKTLIFILKLCIETFEKDWPTCIKVFILSDFSDFIKREPKLLQCVDENKIKAFDEKLKLFRKKIGPHTRGCSMCDPMCFAPPRQYFNSCSMLASRTNF